MGAQAATATPHTARALNPGSGVGTRRLTCGQAVQPDANRLQTPKRENLTGWLAGAG
jgi:hypothetical protein